MRIGFPSKPVSGGRLAMGGRILAFGAAAMLAAGAVRAQGEGAAVRPHDGASVIDGVTLSGACGRGFAGDYTVSDGRIFGRFIGPGGMREVTGTVSPDGALLMRIGGDGLVLRGRLQWRIGSGEWESPACSGRFMTNRR
jgi:hypothetical protein